MKRLSKILGVLLAMAILLCTSTAFATEYEDMPAYYAESSASSYVDEQAVMETTADNDEDEGTNELVYIGGSVLIGVLAAFIFVKSVKGKHKTANKKSSADDYVVPGSLNITQSYEAFLYKNVTKTEKQQNNNQQAKN